LRRRYLTLAALTVCLSPSISSQESPRGGASDQEAGTAAGSQEARPRRSRISPARRIVDSADLDGSGEVDREEWNRFLEALEADADGYVEPDRLLAIVVVPMIDQDGDMKLTLEDLFAIFEEADKDLDFRLDSRELNPPRGRTTGATTQRERDAFMRPLPLLVADADSDGLLEADEWGAFLDALGTEGAEPLESLPWPVVESWVASVIVDSIDESDFAALGQPGGFLRWLLDASDSDLDGRLSIFDLDPLFDERDFDGSGIVSADELRWGARPRGRSRERREREPLMPWQRNPEDALALSRETGKPLLICVNMDGEMASESLARSRYRSPEFVGLAEGFIPLIVSPNRRNKRDYNDRGQRIVDSKFGRVVNREHIDVEPELYERYFEGRRIAPRHVGVDPSGEVLFDIFLVNDLSVIDEALREHGVEGPGAADPGEMDESELLASPWASHREALEKRYLEADQRTRARLAGLALSQARTVQHPELLRLAILDPAPLVRVQAAWNMIQNPEQAPLEFFADAYHAVSAQPAAANALVAAIARQAGTDDAGLAARHLHDALSGLARTSSTVDLERWRTSLSWSGTTRPVLEEREELTGLLDDLGKRLSDREDAELHLAFAATSMRLAQLTLREGGNPSFLFEDVLTSGRSAVELGGEDPDPRALAYLAWASFMLADTTQAGAYAEQAVEGMPAWAGTPLAAKTLEVLATARMRAVYDDLTARQPFSPEAVADVHAAHELLLLHPAGNEVQAVNYITFLDTLGVVHAQASFVPRALERFPRSSELHGKLRLQRLRLGGAEALAHAYDAFPFDEELAPTFEWYRGLALLVAAERHVQNRELSLGIEAYERSAEHFLASSAADATFVDSSSHYVSLARAGTARIHTDAGRLDEAIAAVEAGLDASSRSIWSVDGLGNAPRDTALLLLRTLTAQGRDEQARELEGFLEDHGVSP